MLFEQQLFGILQFVKHTDVTQILQLIILFCAHICSFGKFQTNQIYHRYRDPDTRDIGGPEIPVAGTVLFSFIEIIFDEETQDKHVSKFRPAYWDGRTGQGA